MRIMQAAVALALLPEALAAWLSATPASSVSAASPSRPRAATLLARKQAPSVPITDPVADQLYTAATAHQEAAEAIKQAATALKETASSLKTTVKQVAEASEEEHKLKKAVRKHIEQSGEELHRLEESLTPAQFLRELVAEEGEHQSGSPPPGSEAAATEQEAMEGMALFPKLDLDGNGGITRLEIGQVLHDPAMKDVWQFLPQDEHKLEEIFHQVDTNADDAIEPAEFHAMLEHMEKMHQIMMVFHKLDLDGNGGITRLEIGKSFDDPSMKDLWEFLPPDQQKLEAMFKQVDANGDDAIEPDEFFAMVEHVEKIHEEMAVFHKLDLDANGGITRNEIMTVLSEPAMKDLWHFLPKDEMKLEAIFKQIDVNSDDAIEPDEFLAMVAYMDSMDGSGFGDGGVPPLVMPAAPAASPAAASPAQGLAVPPTSYTVAVAAQGAPGGIIPSAPAAAPSFVTPAR